jgi:hypothetical protein
VKSNEDAEKRLKSDVAGSGGVKRQRRENEKKWRESQKYQRGSAGGNGVSMAKAIMK